MNIPGYDQAPPEPQMQADGDPGQMEQAGDGLHHHEIHEDEGGGFHSIHTFPDGHQDAADHVDYNEAKEKQDADFGCGDDMGGEDDGVDMSDDSEEAENVAKAYGSKAKNA